MEMKVEYSTIELMACAASKILDDKKSILVGTGLPIIAAALAQKTHAPNLLIVFEAGGMGPQIPMLPISVGDSRTFYRALMASSMDYVMSTAQLGYVDYSFLGAAQIDMYGNINTTVIGSHEKPKVRLPGSGGANDAGSLCWRTIILMQQNKRKFVEKVDFLTTPGYLSGVGAREKAGLPADTGPYRVITQLGIMGFDEKTKRMTLLSVHPGVTADQVKASTEFKLIVSDNVTVTKPPTEKELEILRTEIDPAGMVLGRR
ncbi:MAG: 3-oxoacid CoA-transferase [Candidatus Bathyarchaeota archaeon]|nr:3-oxoacid CoA-transferase [Candidatus Bathyarchaeota archaeon]MDH5494283.1 3-oxoacid CoA-transferase [Candidatus Bathyarchaeota archaeon]